METYDYFYDAQIRRYLTQIVRAFSGFQYEISARDGIPAQLLLVPCRMASQSKQVAHITKNQSENTTLSTPMITVFIREAEINRSRTQNPSHVSVVQVTERAHVDGEYTSDRGNGYTVERLMPHPLDLTIQVDLWTSNEHQKHQIWEQIYMAFNTDFDIQSSDNPLDWTALTRMTLTGMTWSSRSIPVGVANEIDIATFTFTLPIWINPPAMVKRQKLIHQIVTNIHEADVLQKPDRLGDIEQQMEGATAMSQVIVTPKNARIDIKGNEITLLAVKGLETDIEGELMDWHSFLQPYGPLTPGVTQLRLRADIEQDIELDIIGTIQKDAHRPNVLIWSVDIDTLPGNTIPPVNAIIDPMVHHPLGGTNGSLDGILPPAQEGQRYLLLGELGTTKAWGNLLGTSGSPLTEGGSQVTAVAGDILEYRNGFWCIAFDSRSTTTTQYVVNLKSGKQLKFTNGQWILAVDGEYFPGFWRLRF